MEILIGHRASLGLTGVYFKPTPNDLLEGNDKMLGYANVMKSLTISDENKLRLEVETLSARKKESDTIINDKLQEKDQELKLVQKQLSSNQLQIQALISALSNMSDSTKNEIGKKLFEEGVYRMKIQPGLEK